MTVITIDPIVTLLFAAPLLLSLLGIRQKSRKEGYLNALHAILNGKNDEALEWLKKTVESDSENIMAYIQLGNIYRKKNNPVRAAKIHRNLLVRGDLKGPEIDTILRSLLLDYRDASMTDKAIETAERILHRNRKDLDIKMLLLSLYEEKGDWDKAFFYRQNINKWTNRESSTLALYKVCSGQAYVKKGAEREARIRFREALKLDKQCVPAYLYCGDSYKREGRNEEALRIWQELTVKNPKGAWLAYSRLKEILFDLGRYGEIEEIYRQVLKKLPKDPVTSLSLAEYFKKQGRFQEGLDLCRRVLEAEPQAMKAESLLIQFLSLNGDEPEAIREAVRFLNQLSVKHLFSCSECQHQSEEPFWRCPSCHQWNTIRY